MGSFNMGKPELKKKLKKQKTATYDWKINNKIQMLTWNNRNLAKLILWSMATTAKNCFPQNPREILLFY